MRKTGLITVSVLVSVLVLNGCVKHGQFSSKDLGFFKPLSVDQGNSAKSGEPFSNSEHIVLAPPVEQKMNTPLASPFLGRVGTKEIELLRPVMVMVENSPAARPQAGLEEASIVYEFLVEGGITRFLALFYESFPERVGPVRSTRPYFVQIVNEYDALLLHVGASTEGYRAIARTQVNDIDQLVAPGYFWRDSNRRMPHNCYTGKSKLEKYFKKYPNRKDVSAHFFYQQAAQIPEKVKIVAKEVKISYWGGYLVGYNYDLAKKSYMRLINGQPHQMESGKKVYADNILIQYVDTNVKDAEGRLDIKLVGNGKALLFRDGFGLKITWEKKENGKTIFMDPTGSEVKLNPGQTWIQIVPLSAKVDY